jgi:hypothetical protein
MKKILLLVLVIVVIWAVVVSLHDRPQHLISAAALPVNHFQPVTEQQAEEAVTVGHPVIQGGIHTLADLRAALKKYPDLYRDFDVAHAHVIRLDHALLAYLSFRIGDKILWTRKAVLIREGSEVWTDDNGHFVKVACGNSFLVVPESELPLDYSTIDAPETVPPVDQLLADLPMLPDEPSLLTPPDESQTTILPSELPATPYAPCCLIGGSLSPKVTPAVATPESTTLSMVLLGIVCLVRRRT